MAQLEPMETGLIVWADGTASEALDYLKSFGLRAGQLGVPPSLECTAVLEEWKDCLASSGVALNSVACSYAGEDYTTLERVHATVGFTSPEFRRERLQRTQDVAAFANALGIKALSCHIGFVPDRPEDLLYKDLLQVTREICDTCAGLGQDFALETGQESAATLVSFIADVDRPNLKVNFDPANMVIYGVGDPVQALTLLQGHVTSVHCKDALPPAAAGRMGQECRLGDGAVDFPAFLAQLKRMGYTGFLTIEREEPDAERKAEDVRMAVARLNAWKTKL